MSEQPDLSSDQQTALAAIGELEVTQGHPPTLEDVAGYLGWPRERTREVLATLLSGGADVVRQLSAGEPSEGAYALKRRPAP